MEQDTALARALLALADVIEGGQTAVADALDRDQSLLSKWKKTIGEGGEVSMQKRTREAGEALLMQEGGEGFRDGVRLVLDYARVALDDLEARLTVTSTDGAKAQGAADKVKGARKKRRRRNGSDE